MQPAGLVRALASATSFLLAAAILIGAIRWPAGRTWLMWSAGAFAVHGLLELGLAVWFAWWDATGPQPFSDSEQTALIVRAAVSIVAITAAWVCVAMGIWLARPFRSTIGRGRLAAMIAVGILGLIATGAGFVIAASAGGSVAPLALVSAGLYAIDALSLAGTAALAIAAMWHLSSRNRIPEQLIAAGGALVVAAAAWSQSFLARTDLSQSTLGDVAWNFTLPSAVGLLGMVALITGFFAGRWFPEVAD